MSLTRELLQPYLIQAMDDNATAKTEFGGAGELSESVVVYYAGFRYAWDRVNQDSRNALGPLGAVSTLDYVHIPYEVQFRHYLKEALVCMLGRSSDGIQFLIQQGYIDFALMN